MKQGMNEMVREVKMMEVEGCGWSCRWRMEWHMKGRVDKRRCGQLNLQRM